MLKFVPEKPGHITLKGELDFSMAEQFRKELATQRQSAKSFVFDFSEVTETDVCGMQVLVAFAREVKEVRLLNVNPDHAKMMRQTGIAGRLHVEEKN